MSIVERAIKKSQEQAKPASDAAEADAVVAAGIAGAPLSATSAADSRRAVVGDPLAAACSARPALQVDLDQMRALGRLPPADATLRANEELRRIKWPLLKAIQGRSGVALRNNVVLVTSALPSEGKSYTSLSLALNIVRDRDIRVILVDGDVAKPALTPAFGLDEATGLNDVLEHPELEVTKAIHRTSIDGLYFLPAGKWYDESPELFAGARMQRTIAELSLLAGTGGIVILDSPPLLATNEAQVATKFVGQVLLVVRAEYTEQRPVLDAIGMIDKSTPVAAVLNRVEPSLVSRYYGHYYYGYGSKEGYEYRRGKASGEEQK